MIQNCNKQITFRENTGSVESICSSTTRKASLSLAVLCLCYFFDQQFVNTWCPVILAGICLSALFSLRRIPLSKVVLLPVTWFLLTCTVYYGVGPLLFVYGNEVSIANAKAFYYVDERALWRTNLLNVVSIALILFFFSVGVSVPLLRPFKRVCDAAVLKRNAHFFAGIGVAFTLLHYGLRAVYPSILMPGIFYVLGKCSFASLFLYTLLYFRGVRKTKVPLMLMAGFVGYFAFTSLMKQEILEFGITLFLGFFLALPSLRKLVIAVCVALVMLPAINMLTSYGRILAWQQGGGENRASATDIISAMSNTEAISTLNENFAGDQSLWRRVSQVPSQAFAMDAYDAGRPGNTLWLALWAFVPRILCPDKPVITQGENFTILVRGSADGGGNGAGFFGEAYWNLGWPGVFLVSVFVGILLAGITQFNLRMASTGNYQFFPVAFMALAVGYRVDDWLVATTFNSIPMMVALYIMINFISRRSSRVV